MWWREVVKSDKSWHQTRQLNMKKYLEQHLQWEETSSDPGPYSGKDYYSFPSHDEHTWLSWSGPNHCLWQNILKAQTSYAAVTKQAIAIWSGTN